MKQFSQAALAEVIKRQRSQMGITQEQLSQYTGINRTMIGRMERMDYIPTITQLEKLEEVLEFQIEEVLADEEKPTVYTAFRGSNLSNQEQEGVNHLLDMMLAAKQQILLWRSLNHE